jgi:hypothetical protein
VLRPEPPQLQRTARTAQHIQAPDAVESVRAAIHPRNTHRVPFNALCPQGTRWPSETAVRTRKEVPRWRRYRRITRRSQSMAGSATSTTTTMRVPMASGSNQSIGLPVRPGVCCARSAKGYKHHSKWASRLSIDDLPVAAQSLTGSSKVIARARARSPRRDCRASGKQAQRKSPVALARLEGLVTKRRPAHCGIEPPSLSLFRLK